MNVIHWSARLEATTAVACDFSYTVENTLLRIDTIQQYTSHFIQTQGSLKRTGDKLDDCTDDDFHQDYIYLTENVYPDAFPSSAEFTGPEMFALMAQMHAVDDNVVYLDSTMLMNRASRTFEMLAAQMASADLRISHKRNLTGSMEYFEGRLHVKALSFWVMGACFASMFGLTLIIIAARPHVRLLQEPGSLGNYACILALRKEPTAARRKDTQDTLVAGLSRKFHPLTVQRKRGIKSHGSWHPFAASKIFKVASLIASFATLGVLAVLQYLSDSNNGIANIQSSSNLSHSLSTYIPAAFTLLLATLCTSAAFVITTLYPYHHLKRDSAKAERSVLLDICGKSPSIVL